MVLDVEVDDAFHNVRDLVRSLPVVDYPAFVFFDVHGKALHPRGRIVGMGSAESFDHAMRELWPPINPDVDRYLRNKKWPTPPGIMYPP